MIKLPVFKKINFRIYATNLCQFKCWELFPSLNEGKNCKILQSILIEMITNS